MRTPSPLHRLRLPALAGALVLLLLLTPGRANSGDAFGDLLRDDVATASAASAEAGPDEEAIRELLSRTARANNEGDVEGWLAAFAPDAVYMPSGMPAVTDREELREVATSGFGSWDADIEIVPVDVTVSGEWAFARARVTGHVTSRSSGETIQIDNKELLVFRRYAEGGWRIYRMMINSNG